MSMAVLQCTDVDPDTGLAVDVSRAEGAEAIVRLRREAQLLRAARHPGVVELVELHAEDGWAELHTVAVGGAPLEALLPLPAEELAGLVAGVATTLSDLHGLGIVHGRIDTHRVVVRPDGRPLLRGFGEGGREGELGADGSVLEPSRDVQALGRLVAHALEVPSASDPWQALQDRLPARSLQSWRSRLGRLVRRSQPPPSAGEDAAAVLAEVARAACDPDPSSRPTSAEIAAALHRRIPAARLPVPAVAADGEGPVATASPPPDRPGPRPRRRLLPVALLVALAATAAASSRLAFGPSAPGTAPAPPAAAPPPSSVSRTPPLRPAAERVWPASAHMRACPLLDVPLRADVDGDGCEEALAFGRGILQAGAVRYAVGGEGDVVATGDWDCDGRSTLALLRGRSGGVWVFDEWAGPGQSLPGRRAGRVDGAVALEAVDGGGGCDELLARRADGSRQLVPSSR